MYSIIYLLAVAAIGLNPFASAIPPSPVSLPYHVEGMNGAGIGNTTDISFSNQIPALQGNPKREIPQYTNLRRTGRSGKELEQHIKLAIDCLSEWCQTSDIRPRRKVRCTVGTGIAYVCNYGNHQPCSKREFEEVWAVIRGSESLTGLWDHSPWAKVIGMEQVNRDGYVGFETMGSSGGICDNVKHQRWQLDKVLPAPQKPAPKNETKGLEGAHQPPSVEEVPEKAPHARPLFNQPTSAMTSELAQST